VEHAFATFFKFMGRFSMLFWEGGGRGSLEKNRGRRPRRVPKTKPKIQRRGAGRGGCPLKIINLEGGGQNQAPHYIND